MISQREVKRRYQAMLKNHSKPVDNEVNCYVCEKCGHITKTIDIDDGVTPFMNECENCGELAQSTFYKDINPTVKPTIEWYRPSLEETIKMRKNPNGEFDHVIRGGLLPRKIIRDN